MDNISERNYQFLLLLRRKKQTLSDQLADYENKIIRLRKTPSTTNSDLLIYQYNVKIEQIKAQLSEIDRQISNTPVSEYAETEHQKRRTPKMENDFENSSPCETEVTAVKPLSFKQKAGLIFNGFKKLETNLLLAAIAVFTIFIMAIFDKFNIITVISRYTFIKLPLMLILFAMIVILTAYYSFRNISTNKPGTTTDYLALYFAIVSLIVLVLFCIDKSVFKLAVFLALTVYYITYFIMRIWLYQNPFAPKNQITKYYYLLFKKYPLLLVLFSFLLLAVLSYLTFYTAIPIAFYKKAATHSFALSFFTIAVILTITYVTISVLTIKVKKIFIIDFINLLLVAFALCFFALYVLSRGRTWDEYIIINLMLFALGTFFSVYRMLSFNPDV